MEGVIVINQRLSVECLRRTNNAIYSIHSIDDDCLLYIEYDQYSVEGISSLKAKFPSIVLPKTVTLSDEDILSINQGVHILKDITDIDPTVNKARMVDYHIITKLDLVNIFSTKEEDFEEFCAMPLFECHKLYAYLWVDGPMLSIEENLNASLIIPDTNNIIDHMNFYNSDTVYFAVSIGVGG